MYAVAQTLDAPDDGLERVRETAREFGVSDSGYFDDVPPERRIALHNLYKEETRRMLAESRKMPRA